jgi:AraC family transcriptional regulator, transcriptional activator of pobA
MQKKISEKQLIPQFALYGEHTPSHALEFVHIEDIHERSARNGWVIKPHRHAHLFQVLCMFTGALQMKLDDGRHTLDGPWAIVLPAGVVHGFEFHPNTQGVVLSLAISQQGADAENQVAGLLAGALAQPMLLRLRKRTVEYQQLQHCLQAIKQELHHRSCNNGCNPVHNLPRDFSRRWKPITNSSGQLLPMPMSCMCRCPH